MGGLQYRILLKRVLYTVYISERTKIEFCVWLSILHPILLQYL